jgi:hypothetical protein
MKPTPVPPGTKVYGFNICQAIRDHAKCPGFTTLAPADSTLVWSPASATATRSCHSATS